MSAQLKPSATGVDAHSTLNSALQRCTGLCGIAMLSLETFVENPDVNSASNSVTQLAETPESQFQLLLEQLVRPGDRLFWLQSRTAVIVLDELIDAHHLQLAAMKFARMLNEQAEEQTALRAHAGFLFVGRISDTESAQSYLDRTEAALLKAKTSSKNNDDAAPYVVDSIDDTETHWQVGVRLREALRSHQIYLDYEPKTRLDSGDLIGAEAIVRWRDKGVVLSPDEYFPALTSEALWELTAYCLRRVIHDLMHHQIGCSVSIKLESSMLVQAELLPLLQHETSLWGVEPSQITLEIDEFADLRETIRYEGILQELHDLGFQVCLSSVEPGRTETDILDQLPLSEIKLCDECCQIAQHDTTQQSLLKSTLAWSTNKNIRVTAHGISDANTLNLLAEMGCTAGQGIYLGAPVPIENFTTLVQ
ncbi:MAG: EAL domain-containing protein [Pseudomonadota bacterium]